MYKTLLFICLLVITGGVTAQTKVKTKTDVPAKTDVAAKTDIAANVIGRVDKRTKGFFIPGELKDKYLIFGYQLPNVTTKKMICFSNSADNLRANYQCPLGTYFDTGQMGPGDNIIFLGMYGPFGKMVFNAGDGKKTIFYLPKASFTIK
jgi:hypothetical protein